MPAHNHTTSAIYSIRCIPTGKIYVGSAIDLTRRFGEHRRCLNAGNHRNGRLQNAWNKYGCDSFAFDVIEIVEPERLIEREQYHIDRLGAARKDIGFNINVTAGSRLGMKHSRETREKLSRFRTGMKMPPEFSERMRGRPCSPESRAKMSLAHAGRKLSEEHRAKIGAAQKGKKLPPHQIEAMRARQIGRPVSEETRAKLSRASKGRVMTEEHKAKIAAAGRGRRASEETRAKLRKNNAMHKEEARAKLRGRKFSDEHRANISAARRAHEAAKASAKSLQSPESSTIEHKFYYQTVFRFWDGGPDAV